MSSSKSSFAKLENICFSFQHMSVIWAHAKTTLAKIGQMVLELVRKMRCMDGGSERERGPDQKIEASDLTTICQCSMTSQLLFVWNMKEMGTQIGWERRALGLRGHRFCNSLR